MRGVCEECGCTQERPCEHQPGVPCQWTDARQDFCSHCALRIAKATDFERLKTDPAYAVRVLRGELFRWNTSVEFTAHLIVASHPELGDVEAVLETALHGGAPEAQLWIPGQ